MTIAWGIASRYPVALANVRRADSGFESATSGATPTKRLERMMGETAGPLRSSVR